MSERINKVPNYQNDDKECEQSVLRSLDMIVDADLRSLHIFSGHIDVTCWSYLTKVYKMLNWGKTVFKTS
jgi:hypothetical protein